MEWGTGILETTKGQMTYTKNSEEFLMMSKLIIRMTKGIINENVERHVFDPVNLNGIWNSVSGIGS